MNPSSATPPTDSGLPITPMPVGSTDHALTDLPRAVQEALVWIGKHGTREEVEGLLSAVAKVIYDAQYDIVRRQLGEGVQIGEIDFETEEEILEFSTRACKRSYG